MKTNYGQKERRQKMKKANLSIILAVGIMGVLGGCEEEQQTTTGFLSDYSYLKQVSDTSYRHIKPGALRGYSAFIIEPVAIHFHSKSKGGNISSQDLSHLRQFMYAELRTAISGKYRIVTTPGPGVARLRVALTDIKQSKTIQNLMPITKMAGTGLGGASMEAELLDSQTGVQIAAVVETQSGNRLSLDGVSKWGDTEAVMKGWAQRFRKRLDEAH